MFNNHRIYKLILYRTKRNCMIDNTHPISGSYNVCHILYARLSFIVSFGNSIKKNILLVFIRTQVKFLIMLHLLFYIYIPYSFRTWTTELHYVRLMAITYCSRMNDDKYQNNGKISFSCLFGNKKRYLLVDFLLYENDNYRKRCLFYVVFLAKQKDVL